MKCEKCNSSNVYPQLIQNTYRTKLVATIVGIAITILAAFIFIDNELILIFSLPFGIVIGRIFALIAVVFEKPKTYFVCQECGHITKV